jgi:hypothetical protein
VHKIVEITKLQAVKEQIDEAIWMFFNRRSAVAIHTIVGAAHQVLHDISQRNMSMVKSKAIAEQTGKGKEWFKRLNKEYNFFKHGEEDADQVLKFDPLLHAYYLVDCVYMYRAVTGTNPKNHRIYDSWFALSHPNAIGSESVREMAKTIPITVLDPNNYEYFSELIKNKS